MRRDATHTRDAVKLPLVAAVLAGGRSRRMGADKRVLEVGGKSMLSLVVDVTQGVCDSTMVVVAQGDDRLDGVDLGSGVTVVHDVIPRIGPLGGVITALEAVEDGWVLVVAADMPLLEPDAIRLLWKHRGARGAVAFCGPRGLEPLLALYHTDCRAAARDIVGEQRASPRALLKCVQTVAVPACALRRSDPQLRSLVNVNTPHEYSKVVQDALVPDAIAASVAAEVQSLGSVEEVRSG